MKANAYLIAILDVNQFPPLVTDIDFWSDSSLNTSGNHIRTLIKEFDGESFDDACKLGRKWMEHNAPQLWAEYCRFNPQSEEAHRREFARSVTYRPWMERARELFREMEKAVK